MKRFMLGAVTVMALVGGITIAGTVASRLGWQPPAWLRSILVLNAAGEFCREHGVPERFCTLCHPELLATLEMCREHGVPEDICTICHPDAEQKYRLKPICEHTLPKFLCPKCQPALAAAEVKSDWCAEHGVPESLCTRCNSALSRTVAMCEKHGVPEALCTICQPALAQNFAVCEPHRLPAAFCPKCGESGGRREEGGERKAEGGGPENSSLLTRNAQRPTSSAGSPPSALRSPPSLPLVRLAVPDVAAKAGIAVQPAARAVSASVLVASGEVDYDETHFAHVRPRLSGIVREVHGKPGDRVTKGQLLAVIDSAELGQAKADYLAALPLVELWTETLARNRGLSERGLVAEKLILEAETELRRAKAETIKVGQRLRNLGLDRQQIAALADEDEDDRNLLNITAPLDGTIVRRKVVAGEAVEPISEIFAVADLARVWVHLDVYEKDLPRLGVAQAVTFRVSGLAPAKFTGTVAWIDAEVNDRTRTIRVRAEIDNTDGLLRAHMFGQGEIAIGEPHQSLVVPRDAVQWEGFSYVVFVQRQPDQPDQFEPRRVLIGRQDGDRFELPWADLKLGELVVTTGSFLLKTEIMKGSIGAGCCGDD